MLKKFINVIIIYFMFFEFLVFVIGLIGGGKALMMEIPFFYWGPLT